MNLTEQQARSYRDAFFKSYPGLASWHQRTRSRQTKESRTLAGRRYRLEDNTPDPQRLNLPIQGTGADGLKLALALLWERREQAPTLSPCWPSMMKSSSRPTPSKPTPWPLGSRLRCWTRWRRWWTPCPSRSKSRPHERGEVLDAVCCLSRAHSMRDILGTKSPTEQA